MKLTKRGEYALRTMIHLGVAGRTGVGVVSVSNLATEGCLPFKFLEAILSELRLAGLVETVRGKNGGARLAKPLEEISMGEIVRLIDGKLAPICCASESAYEPCTCPDAANCGLRMLMIDVRNAIAAILDRYTLADVVSVTLRRADASFQKVEKTNLATRHADPADGFLAALATLAD
jgi:Rrf2 family protein